MTRFSGHLCEEEKVVDHCEPPTPLSPAVTDAGASICRFVGIPVTIQQFNGEVA